MSRRRFLQSAALAGAALALPGPAASERAALERASRIPKVDTHVHLFDLERLSYPWLQKVPKIHRSFSLEDFRKASRGSDVVQMVFVESGASPEQSLEEVRWVAALAARHRQIAGMVAKASLQPDGSFFPSLEALRLHPLVKGIRVATPKAALASTALVKALKAAGRHGFSVDLLLAPDRYKGAAKVIAQAPETQCILDHLGNPDIQGGALEPWKKGLSELAALPNLACKVSGIITRAGKNWKKATLRPYVAHALQAFGPERMMYGGDWPVVLLGGSYRSWARAFEALSKELNAAERARLYHQTARSLYRLAP